MAIFNEGFIKKYFNDINNNKKYNYNRNMTEEDMHIIINIFFSRIYNNIPKEEKENIKIINNIKFNNNNQFTLARIINTLSDKTIRYINSEARDIFDKKYNGVLYITAKNKSIFGGKFVSSK